MIAHLVITDHKSGNATPTLTLPLIGGGDSLPLPTRERAGVRVL